MNLLQRIQSRNSVGMAIIYMMEQVIADAERGETLPDLVLPPVVKSDEVDALIAAGFTSHKKVVEYRDQINEQYNKYKAHDRLVETLKNNSKALSVLINARKIYGKDTLLLPYDKFVTLMKRYGLECGSFHNFKGDIPSDKLQEILELKQKNIRLNDIVPLYPVNKLVCNYWSGRDEYSKINDKLKKFPLLRSISGRVFHTDIIYIDGTKDKLDWCEIETDGCTDFFITAPKRMFKKHYETIMRSKDPFICAYTEYGILIFTRWGEEANDKIIKMAEAFNRKLDEFEQKYLK